MLNPLTKALKAEVGNVNRQCETLPPLSPFVAALYRSTKPLPPNDALNMHVHFAGLKAEWQGCQSL